MSVDANVWRPPVAATAVRTTGRGASRRLSRAAEGKGTAGDDPAARYRRAGNGLPIHPELHGHFFKRNRTSIIATALMFVIYGVLAYLTYRMMGNSLIEEIGATTEEMYGQPTKLTWGQINEAYLTVLPFALYTLAAWSAVVILLDRLRPTTWSMKLLAFGWGASVAIFISASLNTWAGDLMRIKGTVDPSSGVRSAIYSAPFVEEMAKATVLFWLVILLRRRIVAVHQAFTLAAFSALGFAASENVVYYLRQFMYATAIYQVDAKEELHNIVLLRGVLTSFGHPLFTTMTALGLIVAITNRSKLVRALAPLAGYLAACFGHMLFNGTATVINSTLVLAVGGWIGITIVLVILIIGYVKQIRNIRARLEEYVQVGWLQPEDPANFTKFFGRWRMIWAAALRGPRVLRHSLRLQRYMTELASLRQAEISGTMDAMAIERERLLVLAIEESRVWGISTNQGLRFIPPEWGPAIKAFFIALRAKLRLPRRHRQPPPDPTWAPPTSPPVAVPSGAPTWR